MSKQITKKSGSSTGVGRTPAEIHVHVWPAEYPIPYGQVEVYTTRGRSVVFSLDEWRDLVRSVEEAAQKGAA